MYGEPWVENRQQMWDKLISLRAVSQVPWVALGDFNETMWQYEHFSSMAWPERQMFAFRDALSTYELHDVGFEELPYTYDNKQSGYINVRVRLDRVV